jgi:uncharacterized LabA/DUF88 family protein
MDTHVFIDGDYFIQSYEDKGTRVDFTLLRDKLNDKYGPVSIDLYAYIDRSTTNSLKPQLDFISYNGFQVHESNDECGIIPKMSVDMVECVFLEKPSRIALFINDSAFISAVKVLKRNGIYVDLYSTKYSKASDSCVAPCSRGLIRNSNTFTDVDTIIESCKYDSFGKKWVETDESLGK